MQLNKKTPLVVALFSPILVYSLLADEMWFNPATGKYEKVINEDEKNKKSTETESKKTEMWFNPKTQKYEKVLIENTKSGKNVQKNSSKPNSFVAPASLDNGLPASTAKNWKQLQTKKSSANWKTYKNTKTGEIVSFNPKNSELWFNPFKKKWEPVSRELESQKNYFNKQVVKMKNEAREKIMKNKPRNAKGWRCNFSGSIHNNPYDCEDPDQGGKWE